MEKERASHSASKNTLPARLQAEIGNLYMDSESDYISSDSDSEGSDLSEDCNGEEASDNITTSHSSSLEWSGVNFLKKNIYFHAYKGMLVEDVGDDPIDYFNLLFDEEIINLIVTQTNIYAEEVFLTKDSTPESRIASWKDLTPRELRTFIGLYLHMGNIKLSRIADYWKTDELYNMPCFAASMSRNRFFLILRHLHFSSNDVNSTPDRLYKIKPLLHYFNEKMRKVYAPGKELCLDEPMVLWRGRLIFRQFIKGKHHKHSIKIYMLTEPNGLIMKLLTYIGSNDGDKGGNIHACKVVMHMMKERLNLGHSLYMESFYSSYDLAHDLLIKNTLCTGILNMNRKNNPKEVISTKLKKGDVKSLHRNGITVAKWKDRSDVLFITSEHSSELVDITNKRGVTKKRPDAIKKYNSVMNRVDLQEQLMSCYLHERRTRWYKKLGLHIIQLLLLNSYFLFNKYSGQRLGLYEFRHAVIRKLLTPKRRRDDSPEGLPTQHLPIKIRKQEGQKRTLRKKCKVCTKNNKRTDTSYICATCPDTPGLCLGKCFLSYHDK